ncbi:transcriptional regulator, TetR family [Gracilibacillus ureilyticus]|uniref:Transcriptional regulator, TetR family n=1 Tax=Gracilibacillus ureilyticus TaxID=531814 RepID=A0A1H9U8X3_9BACI|nr:TetR/AcrR family transcriptional regulator [Gracilibacillus ureilyticus]SES06030.1 transcriptional regulator, TetR family [Gracilibacillus ureilyticus]
MDRTKQKIIEATISLFVSKGYKGTTTKEIAKASGVNEVTIFRHFGNKRGLFEAIIDSLTFQQVFPDDFSETLSWDLEKDLLVISKKYHETLDSISDLVLIGFREAGNHPELNDLISKFPKSFKTIVYNYLLEMRKQNKLIEVNIELQAMNFVWLNFGYFISKSRFGQQIISVEQDEFLEQSILLFARGLTP